MRQCLLACALTALSACAEPYVPGALLGKDPMWPNARTAGCLDFLAGTSVSHEASPGGVLVWLELGNRCDHSVPVDLTKLRVTGEEDRARAATPYDPKQEMRAGAIEAHAHGTERIEYYGVDPTETRVCIEWLAIIGERGAVVPDPSPICVTTRRPSWEHHT